MKILMIDTRKKHKIFYDPLRQAVMKSMREIGEPVTAKDVSKNLNIAHSKIHYHMQKLLEIEAIKQTHTKMINGIVAKYYVLDYKDVTIMANPSEHLTNEMLMDESLRIIKADMDANFEDLLVAYNELKDRLANEQKCYGVHFYHDDIYLKFEERMELQELIRDYLETHGTKPKNLKGTTKSRVHFQMYDLEINE